MISSTEIGAEIITTRDNQYHHFTFHSRNLYVEESFPDGAVEMKSAQSETVSGQ